MANVFIERDTVSGSLVSHKMVAKLFMATFNSVIEVLRMEFNRYRNDDSMMTSPNLKESIVMQIENSQTYTTYSWKLYDYNQDNGELSLLSKISPDIFTDLVLETRTLESEAIGREMMEEDQVYQMLHNSPTIDEYNKTHNKKTSSGGYVIPK